MSAGVSTDYGYTSSTAYQRAQQEKSAANSGEVSYQSFLKLLTTQLANQDPLSPMEDIDFTGQLAQLQALDEQMAMTKTMQQMRTDTQLQAGTAMIGKFVLGVNRTTGEEASGLVSRVVQNKDGVFVELADKTRIAVGDINNVWDDANSMSRDLIGSSGAINMWIEAGVDPVTQQPIRGIVETVKMVNGQVVLQLYSGEEVTWDQVTVMRPFTEAEAVFALPPELRDQVLKAMEMGDMGVTGRDADGNVVRGIVQGYNIVDGKVVVYLYNPSDPENPPAIAYGDITAGPRKPTAEDAAASLNGAWVTGLGSDGEDVEGVVVGAEENEDGMALILDSGQRLYFDVVKSIEKAKGEQQARMHGMFVEGTGADGGAAGGVAIQKVEVNGELAFRLHTGAIILCRNIANVREATDEEAAAARAVEDALNEEAA